MYFLGEFGYKSLAVMDESAIDDYSSSPRRVGADIVVTCPAIGRKKSEKCDAKFFLIVLLVVSLIY